MSLISVMSASDRSVPNAPTIGTATNVGTARAYNNGAATVTFTAPIYDGRTPITAYTATSSPGGFTASGASSPLTVTGLASATAYTFTVTATNAIGTSAASSASNSITATTIPQAPTIGTATGGNANATVTYTANGTGGVAETAYTATASPGGATGTGASPITVSGLSNGTAYTFTVTATNANGTSTASAASNSVTPILKPVVTGGTLGSDATYFYRTFTGNGTLGVSGTSIAVDISCSCWRRWWLHQLLALIKRSGGTGAGGLRSSSATLGCWVIFCRRLVVVEEIRRCNGSRFII
jgi:hypothetical protein